MADFNYGSFIWGIAEKLRGTYRRSDNGKVILPFTVLRRLDCVLQPTKQAVLDAAKEATGDGVAKDFILQRVVQLRGREGTSEKNFDTNIARMKR